MSRYLVQPNRSLFIKYIPFDTRTEDLRMVFSEFGRVKDVYIPRDYYTGRIRGFAYVEFERLRDAEYVIRSGNRIRLFGQDLRVEFAQGDRKTPKEMRYRQKNRNRHYHRSPNYRNERRNYYRSRSRSRTPPKRKRSSDRSSRSRSISSSRHGNYKRSHQKSSTSPSNKKYGQTNYNYSQDDFLMALHEFNDNYNIPNDLMDPRDFIISREQK